MIRAQWAESHALNVQKFTGSLCTRLILQFTRMQSYLHQDMFAQDRMVAAVCSVTYGCVISIRYHATHDQQAMCEVYSGSEGTYSERSRTAAEHSGRAGTVEGQAQWEGSQAKTSRKHHRNITSYFAVAQLARSCTKQSLHIVNGMYQRPIPARLHRVKEDPGLKDWNHSKTLHLERTIQSRNNPV